LNSPTFYSWFNLRLKELLLISLAGLVLLLWLAIVTYNPLDPSLNSALDNIAKIHNWLGFIGAVSADLLLLTIGFGAHFLLPVLLCKLVQLFITRHNWQLVPAVLAFRLGGFILLLLAAAAVSSIQFDAQNILPAGGGGILGHFIGEPLIIKFNVHNATALCLLAFVFGATIFADLKWLTIFEVIGKLTLDLVEFGILLASYAIKSNKNYKKEVEQVQKQQDELIKQNLKQENNIEQIDEADRKTPELDLSKIKLSKLNKASINAETENEPQSAFKQNVQPMFEHQVRPDQTPKIELVIKPFTPENNSPPNVPISAKEEQSPSMPAVQPKEELEAPPVVPAANNQQEDVLGFSANTDDFENFENANELENLDAANENNEPIIEEEYNFDVVDSLATEQIIIEPELDLELEPTLFDAGDENEEEQSLNSNNSTQLSMNDFLGFSADDLDDDLETENSNIENMPKMIQENKIKTQNNLAQELANIVPELLPANDLKGTLPSLDLLDKADNEGAIYSEQTLVAMSRQLEITLKEFGVEVTVVTVSPGPVITRFEILLAPGVKVSRIVFLNKDIARSMAVDAVRIVEVISGKTTVGIEIPNKERQIVRLSSVLASDNYQDSKSPVTVALGQDIEGAPVIADLAKMPHLLVAGTTGSGKSVGVNAMILSILLKAHPSEVRLIMIDPKMLELSIYEDIPHLLCPVVTDMKEAANALRWAVAEMDRRYHLMAVCGVRKFDAFNTKIKDNKALGQPMFDPLFKRSSSAEAIPELEPLPLIVIIIDEFADMIMTVGKKVEELIARIAQKARAAGIHLVLATQRPTVNVITGLIKGNVPSRIAFQVSSKLDSRTILDQGGAEQLLGKGDMLYLPPGTGFPVRVHGAFVSDDEVHRIVEAWKLRGEPDYIKSIVVGSLEVDSSIDDEDCNIKEEDRDAYEAAVEFVLQNNYVSISSIQRKLNVGYNKAATFVEEMERTGIVSAPNNTGRRELLAKNNDD